MTISLFDCLEVVHFYTATNVEEDFHHCHNSYQELVLNGILHILIKHIKLINVYEK